MSDMLENVKRWSSEYYDVPGIPAHLRPLGNVMGIPVLETPHLRYDEMMLAQNKALVGEVAHFKYRLDQIAANNECRKRARRHIEREASRILGEPWTCREEVRT